MTEAQTDHRNKMLALARAWQESGAPARVFAREHGVTTWTLYYWRQRVPHQERAARRPPPAPHAFGAGARRRHARRPGP